MTEEDELEQFDKPFNEVLDAMAEKIDPRTSRKMMERSGLGKLIDFGILLRRGFQEAWQFVVIIQALFIFLGLSPQVSEALAQIGINISGFWLGVFAIGGIGFFFIFGLALLLYGGSIRAKSLVGQKQNPAQMADVTYYRGASRKLIELDRRLEKIEKILEKDRKNEIG